MQGFVGALQEHGAQKGVFFTTSTFTKEAAQSAQNNKLVKVVLVDGPALVRLMVDFNVGVSISQTYQIKKLDEDFFQE